MMMRARVTGTVLRAIGLFTVLFMVMGAVLVAPSVGAQEPEGTANRIQNGFASIRLGLSFDAVEQRLTESGAFRYRGEPDVSMVPMQNRRVIEAQGGTFVERGFFQFSDSQLYIIILNLDRSELDHYTLYTTLTEKYGEPASLSPEEIVWEDDAVRLSLERPLTVKYVAKEVFEGLMAEGQVEESARTLSREQFIQQF
jgi:hypothetical protein